ncbi:hypothetical protein FOL47_004899 [Perkinsus chesapeaki]|uniref:Sorl1p n=1 Tax=Perkinsus chesapeaki TaxID=330153 RepID=A0A7J6M066_PERCH|nr:hypothetical protein FOL47_004899 [Perkinsus chesapeaki]
MFNLLFPICFALSALGRTVIAGSPMLRASAHTCSSSNFCEVDSNNYPDMLPMGDISVVSFSIDDLGEWFIAGKENGIGKLWVVSCDLQSYKLVVEKNFSDIEVSPDGSEVYGIADGSVYDVLATNPNEFIEIAPADPTRDYTGVAFDSEHQLLYVTGKASNSVYTFVKNGSSWKPMQGYTNDALQHPTSIRYLQGYIYIRVSNGVARLNFAAGRDQTPVMYTNLGITGDEDFTVAPDNYLYYRHGDDAVYRKPLNDHGHDMYCW